MARIVIAPDSFKGSATSGEAANAIARGWRSLRSDDEVICIPMADGGEGTLLAIEAVQPDAVRTYVDVIGPDGRDVRAYWLLGSEATAYVELAQSSGLTLMATRDAMGAHTFGLGQVLANACADARVRKIVIALGGSASTDGATGALAALGYQFLDREGVPIPLGGQSLITIDRILNTNVIAPPVDGVVALVDVNAPLLGANGAAAIFAPQKGARDSDVIALENGLRHFASLVGRADCAGSGAAGGSAYGLRTLWGAALASGAELISKMTNIDDEIRSADLVITGEGQLDAQSFSGKILGDLTHRAHSAGIEIYYCVGDYVKESAPADSAVFTLKSLALSSQDAMSDAITYLEMTGAAMARKYSLSVGSSD
ncbi:unannotated protein [freshwater metagenome]|uniref:Unannotated protein n=1 Tax=freshwater metagenome TaxID=449393 RepID=A0A6J7XS15_9ZZZZ|nr:glycerate kinase [Actinomycetota bacterium]